MEARPDPSTPKIDASRWQRWMADGRLTSDSTASTNEIIRPMAPDSLNQALT